jgi:hypothetical protein
MEATASQSHNDARGRHNDFVTAPRLEELPARRLRVGRRLLTGRNARRPGRRASVLSSPEAASPSSLKAQASSSRLPETRRRASLLHNVARRGTLRASDADRDEIIDRLRKASAEGRLALRELEHRVATALRARTFAELDATVSDLPGGRLGERRSAPRRAAGMVQAHPALLLLAIPLALAAAVTLVAITLLWSTLVLVIFLLGHRRHRRPGPWTYTGRHRFGPAQGAQGGRGSWL